ncbi:lipoprotein-releasing system permease protein [Parabacteroides sp. PF5-5]|uniref:FtsX-like permease family protein n=1 Tax=unclassified Parabacteroides TaxID=2649774 RepID=UPI0024770D07|nr:MULTISPECIES: FtsX-like permease family protein [unclassified Parabacteroides]MDH6303398.1 lipoprotein-releasing system permease protein [Parabacteroides sp. PH5-39]MDH6314721.1 lipoprotein-releasing system permease protein [Parabacteroides sp. PF5-13]MDH6318058.1 lipoprotein-releasing system permease protein [Parabacteroides sp. PH5-13]MDH6322011.1 lipoprotein-releasing system permease protein [Parabacteroides sp. PH5-8]MDH6326134.1 lipoprotein-releasing system permease protein [Parabacter
MNISFFIARRYLFSKKSHNAINVISMVAVCGVVVATIALVCALSVFNGFNDLVASMFSNLDPDLKVTPAAGKVFEPSEQLAKLRKLEGVSCVSEVLQENSLIKYSDRQVIAVVKGVDEYYKELTQIDSVLVDGEFILQDEVVDYATLGLGLAASLGIKPSFSFPLEIYAPKRDVSVNLSNPATSFNLEYAYTRAVFRMNQQLYDENYMLVPLSLARTLFTYENEVSALEIKVAKGANAQSVKKQIKALLGNDFEVKDRFEQQEASFKMMQIEKWMTFLILCFILAIALFNVIGSLSMLMIEKQDDIRTLRNMGADDSLIRRIFLFEGWMISGFGALIGIVIGLVICLLQQELGLIKMGAAGAFIIDSYPVRVAFLDIFVVFLTVMAIGFLSAWYPVYKLGDRWLKK